MNRALNFIILMGFVSLFGDVTYEGAKSVTGPFLATLGVSAATVGFIVGFGELVGYALRLVSGYAVDRTKQYWLMTFLGYSLILSIPVLALADRWEIAAILIIFERIGKAIRSPARDAMLSFATKKIGRGLGFGIHEAMDQVGAILGPLIFYIMFLMKAEYREGFALLLVPAILMISILTVTRLSYPVPEVFEGEIKGERKFSGIFWIYTLFVFATMLGFVNFQIVSYHFKVESIVSDAHIPVLYAMAMGVDALMALIVGKTYDRIRLRSLILIPLLTLLSPLFLFSYNLTLVLVGIIFWGSIVGIQETIMRAAIADTVGFEQRGTAYGIFSLAYGAAWFAGSVILGVLYDISIKHLIAFVIGIELISILFLFLIFKKLEID